MFLTAATTATVLKVGQILIACAPAIMSLHSFYESKAQHKNGTNGGDE